MNYYSDNLKHTARKLFYTLLGWSAIIFLGMLVWDLTQWYIINSNSQLGESYISFSFINMALFAVFNVYVLIIFLLYILVFSNWLCFDLLGTLGISSLFFIAEGISGTLYNIISSVVIEILAGKFPTFDDILVPLFIEDFLSHELTMAFLFHQGYVFFLLLPISYWLWCDILKKRKYCIYIHKKLRYCLYLLILTSPPLFLYIAFGFSMF